MSQRECLAAAHRARAGAIGVLTACTCEYPAKRYETASFHAHDCQAHTITISMMDAAKRDGAEPRYLPIEWRKL